MTPTRPFRLGLALLTLAGFVVWLTGCAGRKSGPTDMHRSTLNAQPATFVVPTPQKFTRTVEWYQPGTCLRYGVEESTDLVHWTPVALRWCDYVWHDATIRVTFASNEPAACYRAFASNLP